VLILKRLSFALLVVSSTTMWSDVIHAQDQDNTDLERAVMLFEESEAAYNEGRFNEAAAMLRRAYSLHADPLLLFNLARALEGDGDLDGAIESYQRYIEEAPDASDRDAIEARLRTLRAERDRAARDRPPTDEPTEPQDPEHLSAGRGISPLPWVVAAGGIVVVGLGGIFGAVSQSKASEAADEPVQTTAQSIHDQASTFATLANLFIVVGAVITVGGAVWGVIDLLGGDEEEEGAADADLRIVPGGVVLSGRF
jgi:tetratricopeptide (TPR) repeat protein